MAKRNGFIKILLFLEFLFIFDISNSLLYPQSSSLGLVASVSVPVLELLPERRLLIDWCFQMGYDLPYQLSSFYNIPIWPGKNSPKNRKRDVEGIDWNLENNWLQIGRYHNTSLINGKHPSDFTAGELYKSIENILESYGYHKSCLMRSVCELARHPFDEDHSNMLTDLLTFLLTPSQHEGFASSEQIYRDVYEEAEQRGFLGENCSDIYIDCSNDILSDITQIFNHQ